MVKTLQIFCSQIGQPVCLSDHESFWQTGEYKTCDPLWLEVLSVLIEIVLIGLNQGCMRDSACPTATRLIIEIVRLVWMLNE